MQWHEYFINMAVLVARKSKDSSTKVGAIIVGPDNEVRSSGFNGFPRGVNEDVIKRWERPLKYSYVEHAERNAIYNAARAGIQTKGCTMYLAYGGAPCTDCSRAVVQAGIATVIGPDIKFPGKGEQWEKNLTIGQEILQEGGVSRYEIHVDWLTGGWLKVNGSPQPILFNLEKKELL